MSASKIQQIQEQVHVHINMNEYVELQRVIAEENYNRGIRRGESELIYYLDKIVTGELTRAVINLDDINKDVHPHLERILKVLEQHARAMKSLEVEQPKFKAECGAV